MLWLHGSARGEHALEIEVPSLTLSGALASLYQKVTRSRLALEGGCRELAFPNATFDLVTLYGCSPSPSVLREIRRVLVDGGTALLAADNRWWGGRLRRAAPRPVGARGDLRLRRAALRAGFREARAYWVEPSLAIPRNLIPVIGDRIQTFEAMRAREWGGNVLRSFAAGVGLHGVLYPAVLIVAKT